MPIYKGVMDKARGEAVFQTVNGCAAHSSRRVLTRHLKTCSLVILFTIRLHTGNCGNLAESSANFAPIIGFWVQSLDKKNFLCLGLLEERKFQGKKPKFAVHLLLEK
jgi:hypothetical protein